MDLLQQYWLRMQLAREAAKPDSAVNLARGALLIAAEDCPGLDLEGPLQELDRLAETVRSRVERTGRLATLEALRRTLGDEFDFAGNADDYFDPRNSYLQEVLERRTGIPITLSVVYLEVGWRLGLPLTGVGLPGHFLVRYQGGEGMTYIDPFFGGRLLDEAGCVELMRQAVGEKLQFRPEFLWPVSKRQMLIRILGNLKVIHQQQKDYDRMLSALDRMLLLDADSPAELHERSRLHASHRSFAPAQADLNCLLQQQAHGPAEESARQELERLRRLWLN